MNNISRDDPALMEKVSLRLIPFMLVLYVISYLDRINISFAALQMNKELGITDEAFGFGSGIFFLGYCLFGIPSNLLIEKLGPRRWVSGIMIVWGLLTIAFCLVGNSAQFFGLRLILGLAEAGFFPGMILYLTYWFPPKYYGVAVARFMTAIPVAGITGSAVAAAALSLSGMGGLSGWKWLFITTGIPAVLLGIAVLFLLPDRPTQARWLSKEEGEKVESMVVHRDESGAAAAPKSNFIETLLNLMTWRFALLYFTLTVSMYGFQLWLPQIIKSFGDLSNTQTALIAAVPAVFQAIGMLVIAGNSDRKGERRFHVVAASVATCLGLVAACITDIPWVKLAGLCLAAFGIWGSVGPFWALARGNLKKEDHATGIAFINSVGNLGGFAGPTIVGLVKHGTQGFAGALIALAASSVLAALLAATSPAGTFEQQGERES